MSNNASNISVGKPMPEGAAFIAPADTTLPTDAITALPSIWQCVGYSADSGLTNAMAAETTELKAWGGDTVLSMQTGYNETYKLKLIESMSLVVLSEIFGKDNVSEQDGVIRVAHTAQERNYHPWVFDMILSGDRIKRVVIPDGKITEVGEIAYVDSEPIGYEITITCRSVSGEFSYEYIESTSVD
jgi:hypothetical protein